MLWESAPNYKDPRTGLEEPDGDVLTQVRKLNESIGLKLGRLKRRRVGKAAGDAGTVIDIVTNPKPVFLTIYLTGGGVFEDIEPTFHGGLTGTRNLSTRLIEKDVIADFYDIANLDSDISAYHIGLRVRTPKGRILYWDIEMARIEGIEFKGEMLVGRRTPDDLQQKAAISFAKFITGRLDSHDQYKDRDELLTRRAESFFRTAGTTAAAMANSPAGKSLTDRINRTIKENTKDCWKCNGEGLKSSGKKRHTCPECRGTGILLFP